MQCCVLMLDVTNKSSRQENFYKIMAESALLRGPIPSLDLRQLQLSSILPQQTVAGHLSVWIKPTGQLKSY